MLKLSPRPYPAWTRRTDVSRDDLRMHWAGRQAFAAEQESQATDGAAHSMRSTPRRQRAEAAVLTLARYRCACCGGAANAVHECPGAPIGTCDINALEPVCPRCASADDAQGPMADAIADVMARFRPVATSA